MQTAHAGTSEAAILGRVLDPRRPNLSAAAARSILTLGFSDDDRERMRQLSASAREGTLSPEEQIEIDNYERVAHIIALMKSKARLSLAAR